MGDATPICPACQSEHSYELDGLTVCSMCGHEWDPAAPPESEAEPSRVIRDAVGNVLSDGDDVTVVKDLKVKGASQPIKVGTKVRGIRLVDGVGDHDIDANLPGFGAMQLKSSVVKKA